MEQPHEYSPLEIAFSVVDIVSSVGLLFSIFIWLYVLMQSSHFVPVILYGASVGITSVFFIFTRNRRYYTRKENLYKIFTSSLALPTFLLYHSGIFPFGSAILVCGDLCNIAVISANGFYMPVAQCAEHHVKVQKNCSLYKLLDSETKLRFLSDIITLGTGGITVSAGDFFMIAGKFIMFLETCWWIIN